MKTRIQQCLARTTALLLILAWANTPLLAESLDMITAGGSHTCALKQDGTVVCWGQNDAGQLGEGTTRDWAIPRPVLNLTNVATLAAGSQHTCALHQDGSVSCWGANGFGQLGNGTTENSSIPTPVANLAEVIALGAGHGHTCALKQDGSVACWGANGHGQLGNGTTADALTPTTVMNLNGATTIAVGQEHTCAIRHNGALLHGAVCWGNNGNGQLGDNSTTDRSLPVIVQNSAEMTAISAGGYHTCALMPNQTATCWGFNDMGQLGNNTLVERHVPTPVFSLTEVTAIRTGFYFSCAARGQAPDVAVLCWGYNGFGQLGDGTTINRDLPTVVSDVSGAGVFDVTAGGSHACVLLQQQLGTVATCWGRGESGQLGTGEFTSSSTPIAVDFDAIFPDGFEPQP